MSGYKNTGPWTGAQVDERLGLAGTAIQPGDLGSAASCDIGTGSGDVAAGDHTHADATPAGEGVPGSDGFLSAADKAKIDGLGTAAYTASTAYATSGHDHDSAYAAAAKGVTNGDSHDHNGGDGGQIAYTSLSGTPTLGTAAAKNIPATGNASATEVVYGNDTRLTDSRPPIAHKTSHSLGGADALSPADIGAATAAQGAKADTAVQTADLAALVAVNVAVWADDKTALDLITDQADGAIGATVDTAKLYRWIDSTETWQYITDLRGPQGVGVEGLAVPLIGTGVMTIPAEASIALHLSAYDSYGTYTLTVAHGTATRVADLIHYTAPANACTDTLTVEYGDLSRTLTFTVVAHELIAAPDAPPSFGDPYLGGYYTGTIWDTVCTATDSHSIATGEIALTIPGGAHPFYFGQQIRVAPGPTNANQAFMVGTVVNRADTTLTVNITSVTGSGTYSTWVIAARWAVIVAPKSGGENAGVSYKNAITAAPAACFTLTNGKAATDAMIAADTSTVYPLAHWAKSLRDLNGGAGLSGYTDWYIPARDELELIWRNLKPVTNNNYTTADRYDAAAYTSDANKDDAHTWHGENLNSDPIGAAYTASVPAQTASAAFQSTGAEKLEFGSAYYRSSSESSSSNAWCQGYYSSGPGYQYGLGKANSGRARAVRRSII